MLSCKTSEFKIFLWRNGAVIALDQRSSGSLKSWSRDDFVAGREQMYSNATVIIMLPNNDVVLGLDFNPSLLLNRVVNYKDIMFTFHKTFLVSIHGVHCSLLGKFLDR